MFKYLFIALFPFISFAAQVNLVDITSDEDRIIAKMIVDVNEDNEIVKFYHKRYLHGKLIDVDSFPAELDYNGRTIVEQSGKNIVILRGLNVDGVNGGALEIDYLYNGITGSRSKYEIELEKDTDGQWVLTVGGRVVKHLHCVSNKKLIVGTIGIRTIIVKK